MEVVFTSAVLLFGLGNGIYLWKNHLMDWWSYGHLETVFYVDNCTVKDSQIRQLDKDHCHYARVPLYLTVEIDRTPIEFCVRLMLIL